MEQQKGLTGSTLKIIAMVTMLIDHIGASILERGVMPKVADGSVMDAGVEAMKVYNRWKVVDMACPWHRKDRISDFLLFVSGRIFAYRQLEKIF